MATPNPDFRVSTPDDLPEGLEWTGTDKGLGRKWLVHDTKTDEFSWMQKSGDAWGVPKGGVLRGSKVIASAREKLEAWKKKHTPQIEPTTPVKGPTTISKLGEKPDISLPLDLTPVHHRKTKRKFAEAIPIHLEPVAEEAELVHFLEDQPPSAPDTSGTSANPSDVSSFDISDIEMPTASAVVTPEMKAVVKAASAIGGKKFSTIHGLKHRRGSVEEIKARRARGVKSRKVAQELIIEQRVKARLGDPRDAPFLEERTTRRFKAHTIPVRSSPAVSVSDSSTRERISASVVGSPYIGSTPFTQQPRASRVWKRRENELARLKWRRMMGWSSDWGPTKKYIFQ